MTLFCHIAADNIGEVLLDALKDSLLILPAVFLVYFLIALFERRPWQKAKTALKGPFSPLIGTAVGTVPQCGFGIAATRMYSRGYITLGALISIYIATSDEALFVLVRGGSDVWILLGIKTVYALLAGYAVGAFGFLRGRKSVLATIGGGEHSGENSKPSTFSANSCELDKLSAESFEDTGGHSPDCRCGHSHNNNNGNDGKGGHFFSKSHFKNFKNFSESRSEKHDSQINCRCGHSHSKNHGKAELFLHPLRHSLTIFSYCLAINLVIGLIIFWVTPERLEEFMQTVVAIQPLLAGLVGLIPNCAASLIIAEMYVEGLLTLGGAVAGLSVGAGLCYAVLLKENKDKRGSFAIIGSLFCGGIFLGTLVDIFAALF